MYYSSILILVLIVGFSMVAAFYELRKMLPRKAVVGKKKRAMLEQVLKKPVDYISEPIVDHPVIPFLIFGIHYDKDIVIVSKHPDWNMHEYSLLNLPDGDCWMMKDSKEGSLDQCVTIQRTDIIDWVPEIPLEIAFKPIKIEDRGNEEWEDISFTYENFHGEQVDISYKGKKALRSLKKRNGSTMGHSRNQLIAILDLPERSFGKKAEMTYNSKSYPIKKILGLKSFNMMLSQTQGGISTGAYAQYQEDSKIKTKHKNARETIQDWTLEGKVLEQKSPFRTQQYHFCEDEPYELISANVQLWNNSKKAFNITFYPALPDFRKEFRGKHIAIFVMDVNGQQGHGIGKIHSYWQDKKLIIDFFPENPQWITDRPLRQVITFENNNVNVKAFMRQN